MMRDLGDLWGWGRFVVRAWCMLEAWQLYSGHTGVCPGLCQISKGMDEGFYYIVIE